MADLVNSGHDPTLSDYARSVWQRKWIVMLVTVAVTALALGYTFVQTPLYEAFTQLQYENPLNVADPLSMSYEDTLQMQTVLASVSAVIASPQIDKDARAILSPGGR